MSPKAKWLLLRKSHDNIAAKCCRMNRITASKDEDRRFGWKDNVRKLGRQGFGELSSYPGVARS